VTHLPPLPNGSVTIRIRGDNAGIEWVNTFFASSSTSGTPTRADMDALATALLGTYQTDFRPMMTAGLSIIECDTEYQVAPDSVIPGISVNSLAGTRAGNLLPASSCGVISWHTNFDHYRGGHARSYIPGPAFADLQDNHSFFAAYCTSLDAKAASWLGAINAYAVSPFTSLVMSRVARIRDGQPLDPPVLRAITGHSVKPQLGSQRRRLT
jgi:hypothetical protein